MDIRGEKKLTNELKKPLITRQTPKTTASEPKSFRKDSLARINIHTSVNITDPQLFACSIKHLCQQHCTLIITQTEKLYRKSIQTDVTY